MRLRRMRGTKVDDLDTRLAEGFGDSSAGAHKKCRVALGTARLSASDHR